RTPEPRLRSDMIDQYDFSARPEHARELVERRLRIGDRRNHILRHHHIKRLVRKTETRGVHYGKAFDIDEPMLDDAFLRPPQHRLGDVDADKTIVPRITRQRAPGPNADSEDAPADALGRCDSDPAPAFENWPKHHIVHRCPAGIGFDDGFLVEF